MENILDNAYTNRDFEYLKSKNVEVCIIIQHKVTKEISLRSSVPLIDVKSMLQKTDRDKLHFCSKPANREPMFEC